ncbi:hypothetical protein M405DRAFT_833729 [Rhizopogon salebrosus TDB-379]|nr:hypothetical protein M405DRAFT_833729 [Rhizopogon salebrosus TDB-379]
MLTSCAYFIVALALASFIFVAAVPLAPINIEAYPIRREPVGAHRENNDDVFEVMDPFEAPLAAQAAEDGNQPQVLEKRKECCVQ